MPKDSHELYKHKDKKEKKKRKNKRVQCYSRTCSATAKQYSSHKSKTQHHRGTESEDKNLSDCNTIINAPQHYASWIIRTQP